MLTVKRVLQKPYSGREWGECTRKNHKCSSSLLMYETENNFLGRREYCNNRNFRRR